MARQTRKQAVEQRTQQRLAARKEAAKRGAETRRRKCEGLLADVAAKKAALKKHEAKLVAKTRKMLDAEAAAAEQAGQPQVAKPQAERPERPTGRTSAVSAAMATVALRGEQAERFRALAVRDGLSLAKLLVRMMEVFEAEAR